MGIEKKNPANFSPSVEIPAKVDSFRFWCQKVLPLVYDDSLSYYELLCKVVNYLNNTIADVNTLGTDVDNLNNAYNELQSYVNDYFSTLDVQNEINNKLDAMAQDGSLSALIQPLFDTYKTEINNEVNQQNNKIGVLENRMNTFTSLPSGSTSGDAELIDIRVPASGFNNNKTYANAGDAVRGQVSSLKRDLESIITNTDTFVVNDNGTGHGYYRYNIKLLSGESYLVILEIPSSKSHTIFVGTNNTATDIFSQNSKNGIIEYSPNIDRDFIGFNIIGTEDVSYSFKVIHISKGSTVLDLTNYFVQQSASAINANYVIKANGLLLISTPDGIKTTFVTKDTKNFSYPFSAFINSSHYTDIIFKIDDNTGITPFPIEENKELINKIKIYFINKSITNGYDISLSASDSKECAKRKSDIILNGENDTDVLTSLMSCTEGINIFLYNGTYNINKYWTYNKNCRCSIASWLLPTNKKKRSVVLHGETMSCPTSEDGVFFKVSQELHNAWDNTKNNILLGIPYKVGEYELSHYQIQIENINIMGIKYDKPITYVDYFLADSVALKSVNIRSWNKYPTEYKAFDDTPNLECVGIRCGHSSNFGIQNYVKNSNIWYCGKGVVNNGEHYIIEDVKVHHCYIGWVFGDRPDHGNMEHPNILLGCSTEACYQLGWLTKNGITTDISFDEAHAENNFIRRSTLIIIGMSVENQWQIPINEIVDKKTSDTLPFWEIVHKAYRGRIEIDLYGRKPFTVDKPELNSNMTWVSYPNTN